MSIWRMLDMQDALYLAIYSSVSKLDILASFLAFDCQYFQANKLVVYLSVSNFQVCQFEEMSSIHMIGEVSPSLNLKIVCAI